MSKGQFRPVNGPLGRRSLHPRLAHVGGVSILAVLALVWLSLSPHPALSAETELPTGEDLVRMSRAAQALNSIYEQLLAVVTQTGTIDDLATSMLEGEVSREYATREQRRLLFLAKGQLDQSSHLG